MASSAERNCFGWNLAAMPYEHPKLAVTASIDGRGYGAQIEAAMKLRGMNPVIDCPPKAIAADLPSPDRAMPLTNR